MIYTTKNSKLNFEVIKPVNSILKISEVMMKVGSKFSIQEGKKLDYSDVVKSKYVYSFECGIFTAIHQESNIYLCQDSAPCLYGVAEIFHPVGSYSLIADCLCTGWRVKTDVMGDVLTKYDLKHEVCEILSYRLYQILYRDSQLVGVNSYVMVCNLLHNLMNYPSEIRCKINIQKFICQHTLLSRSNVLNILSGLKKGGYINTLHGTLVNIIHLPDSF
ncbi:helix-turn-helix domain-containing protein [Lelliottia nimipressuralis]|uniref:Helix-turn-helix domain-containing protein n=1 Tax=Lelliottia nimipressuralis TaxID=69220 RepID=A0ABD4KFT0_9ENTR|nr:helix-turn-helix domain-containing protein [Lelliottia nimipressuralis]